MIGAGINSSEEGVEQCFTVGTELGLGWLTAQGIGGVLGSAGEAAQAMRTATNVSQRVLMAGDGVVVAVEATEAEAIANGIRTVGGALGRAAQATGPAPLVSQRGSDRQPQGGSTEQRSQQNLPLTRRGHTFTKHGRHTANGS